MDITSAARGAKKISENESDWVTTSESDGEDEEDSGENMDTSNKHAHRNNRKLHNREQQVIKIIISKII